MIFSSPVFIFLFLPLVLLANFVCKNNYRNFVLIIASLFFYAWGETFYIAIMIISIIVNYTGGLLIEKYRGKNHAKILIIVIIGINLSILMWFKYINFFLDNFNEVLSCLKMSKISLDPVHLPIGISFFTFQALSYIIDVYQGKMEGQRKLTHIALYISLFPQLIAGPIVRYTDIASEIAKRSISLDDFLYGVRRFIIGFAKKMIIANSMGELADQIMGLSYGNYTALLAWIGAIAYTLQIYYDFSGYSDMAIGLGRMLGFHFPENFKFPYISRSIREFWTRWHITLSSWFKDYLYIPAGGNRISPARTYMNLLLVFFLCGLWHGASWNFIIWGFFHGIFIVIEQKGVSKLLSRLWRPLQHFYVLMIVILAWVFFRLENFSDALAYIKTMFGFSTGAIAKFHLSHYLGVEKIIILVAGIILSIPVADMLKKYANQRVITQWIFAIGDAFIMMMFFLFSLMLMASETYNPFIYFRF